MGSVITKTILLATMVFALIPNVMLSEKNRPNIVIPLADEPFFYYMAYNPPHWPLHAIPADVDKFVGKYMKGWDVLHQERFNRQVAMGLFDRSLRVSPRDENVRLWYEV
jgi:hypothetical protein